MMPAVDEARRRRLERTRAPELSGELLRHIFGHIEDDDRGLAAICALNKHWHDFYLKGPRVEERRVVDLLTLRAILGALRRCTDGSFTMLHVVSAVHSVVPDLRSNAISVRELLRDASCQVPLRQVLVAMPEDVQCAAWRLMVSHDSLLVMSRPVDCLETSDDLGLLEDDDVLDVRLSRLAAVQGDAASQTQLGWLYEEGRGGLRRDEAEAARLYGLAADQGNAQGQSNLGFFYSKGLGGLSRDDAEAVRLYRLAADQGNTDAQCRLGFFYHHGRGGLSRDDAEAARLYRLAADQGNAHAQFNLGMCYEEGSGGLSRDDAEAARLFYLAAAQGITEAQNSLERLQSHASE